MCVSAISGKFRTGIQFFLLYRNEVSYKVKIKRNPHFLRNSTKICKFKRFVMLVNAYEKPSNGRYIFKHPPKIS